MYYVADRDLFMTTLNDALRGHPRYPIEIEFYEDPEWDDFQRTLGKIKRPELTRCGLTLRWSAPGQF